MPIVGDFLSLPQNLQLFLLLRHRHRAPLPQNLPLLPQPRHGGRAAGARCSSRRNLLPLLRLLALLLWGHVVAIFLAVAPVVVLLPWPSLILLAGAPTMPPPCYCSPLLPHLLRLPLLGPRRGVVISEPWRAGSRKTVNQSRLLELQLSLRVVRSPSLCLTPSTTTNETPGASKRFQSIPAVAAPVVVEATEGGPADLLSPVAAAAAPVAR